VVQGLSVELQRMKDVIAQKEEESIGWQGQVERLQKQVADRSSRVSSLTMDLKTARQDPNIAVQVLLHA
jgi:predicted  nucleic acid-binding Zn-ribbon protein